MDLGVTNLDSYQVRMTSLCAQWQLHRHATAYRVVIESLEGKLLNNLICSYSPIQRSELHRSCIYAVRSVDCLLKYWKWWTEQWCVHTDSFRMEVASLSFYVKHLFDNLCVLCQGLSTISRGKVITWVFHCCEEQKVDKDELNTSKFVIYHQQ